MIVPCCTCRMLYWTEDGLGIEGIYRTPVDNPAREVVITGDRISTIYALTIDSTGILLDETTV